MSTSVLGFWAPEKEKRVGGAFEKYIFQGLSSWKGRAVSWRWFGVDQRKRLDSFPFPFIPPLTPPLPLPLAGLLGHSSGEESNVLSSGNQHLHFSACKTFSGCKRTKTYREGSRETKCCNSFNSNTNKMKNSNGNIITNVNTNSITVEYESETGGVGWRQTGCGNALKVSLSILGNFFSEFCQLFSSTSSPVLKLGSGLFSGLTRLITRWQRCGHVREATGANQNWSTPVIAQFSEHARTAMTGTKTLIWTK